MAIGVSYTGHDGRSVDFTTDGVPAVGSELDRIVRGGDRAMPQTPLGDLFSRSKRPHAPDPRVEKAAGTVKLNESDHRAGTLAEKVDRSGSIEASNSGLRLKGESMGSPDGIYAKKNGVHGFRTLDEIDDPTKKGGMIGEPDAANRFAPSNKESGSNGAYGVNLQSRTEAEVNEETGEVTFWEYTKRVDVTDGKRVGEVSGETKRKICSFFLGADGDRQITLTGDRAPFTIKRSSFKDDGVTKYEYWVKCLKWNSSTKDAGFTVSGFAYQRLFRDWLGTRNIVEVSYGVYPFGVYGHYPQRPADRPRKITFDSGREAIVDFFEERNLTPCYNDNCNCWTYIGSSDDFPSGKFKLYGYLVKYMIPHESEFVPEQRVTYNDDGNLYFRPGDNNVFERVNGTVEIVTSEHRTFSFENKCVMVVTTQAYDSTTLLNFLQSNGALIGDAYKNDGYDESFWTTTVYVNGVKKVENVVIGNKDYPSLTESAMSQMPEYTSSIEVAWIGKYSSNTYYETYPGYSYVPKYGDDWNRVYGFSFTDVNGGIAEVNDFKIVDMDTLYYKNTYFVVKEKADGYIERIWERFFGSAVDQEGLNVKVENDMVVVGKGNGA